MAVLARLGFPRRDDAGAPFDPARHEAVAARPDPDVPARHGHRGRPAGLRRGRPPAAARAGGGGQGGLMADDRDFYEVLGVPRTRQPGRDPAGLPQAGPDLSPGREQGPGRRGAVQGRLGGLRRAVRPAGPAALRRVRARLPAGARGRRPRGPGRRARAGAAGAARGGPDRGQAGRLRGGRGPRRPARRPVRRARRAGGRCRRGWGPIPGADQEAELELSVEEAYRGGRRTITLPGPAAPDLDVTIPAGVTDGQRIRLAGQGGRAATGPARRPVPGRADRAASPVPARGPRPARRAAGRALGGGPGHLGRRRHAGRRGQGQGARGHLQRPAAAAARPGHAQPAGHAGDLYAEVRIMVPAHPSSAERRLFEELAKVSDFDPRRRHDLCPRSGPPGWISTPFARATGIHPELVRRLVTLGSSDAEPRRRAGQLWFAPAQVRAMARIQRLRAGVRAQLCRRRPRHRPAGPHRRAGERAAPRPTPGG